MNYVATSGIPTYEDVSDIIEALVHTEGRKYGIPGVDFEDTAQEIRLECIRVLKFYDAERIGPSPYKFLQTCVRNFLYNQRRGIWVPNNPPCVRCPLWDKARKTCVIDEVGCEKIVQYRENMAIKANIKQPNSLEVDIMDYSHEEDVDLILLKDSIYQSLPEGLIIYFEKMLLGEKIPAHIKKEIKEIVLTIINNA